MSNPNEVHRDDVGTALILPLKDGGDPLDVSAATALEIHVRKPGGARAVWTAALYTDGTDGKIVYYAVAGDFDTLGTYRLQPWITLPAGQWHGTEFSIRVLPVICPDSSSSPSP